MTPEKITERTEQLAKFARDAVADGATEGEIYSLIADCRNQLNRARKRAKVGEGFERVEIRQMRGPSIEFEGRMLCDTQFTTEGRTALEMTLEVWETRGGALVAVSASTLPGGSGREDERATVVRPRQTWTMDGVNGDHPMIESDDIQAMRFAVMDAFTWQTEAKKMVRKKLGWDLRQEVE